MAYSQNNNTMFSNYPDLLNMDELQNALGVGRTMAYRLINDESIKHFRVGKNIRVPKQFVIDYIFNACYNDGSSKSAVNEKGVKKYDGISN